MITKWILVALALTTAACARVNVNVYPSAPQNRATILPVVPGGQGFGMMTRAAYACGTDPAILRVTNVNDSGSGSLRAALTATGPRVVIFETSGTIVLDSGDITVREPCLTVAGQTAPSPGITVRDGGIWIWTHDVLLQHVRIRVGDRMRSGDPQHQTVKYDALQIYDGPGTNAIDNIVTDHLSISWAGGKNWEMGGGNNPRATAWRCIISEALANAQNVLVLSGEPTSLGMLWGMNANASAIQNLFAHDSDRNPEIHENNQVQFVNNVVYDWGKVGSGPALYPWASLVYTDPAYVYKADIVNNTYIPGQGPHPVTPIYAFGMWYAPNAGSQVYRTGNLVGAPAQDVFLNGHASPFVGASVVPAPAYTAMPAASVEAFVLANAGARPVDRDAVDTRIVTEVRNRTGTVISSPNQVGGWPTLAVNARALTVPANPHVVAASGYTNLEEWLHGYARAVEAPPPQTTCPTQPTSATLPMNTPLTVQFCNPSSENIIGANAYGLGPAAVALTAVMQVGGPYGDGTVLLQGTLPAQPRGTYSVTFRATNYQIASDPNSGTQEGGPSAAFALSVVPPGQAPPSAPTNVVIKK